jgi:hypothetical protein
MAESYTLMRGDTRLGVLAPYDIDQPWILCHFVADSAFGEIQPYFKAELQALEAEPMDVDAWEKTYEAIDALDIHLVGDDGKDVGPMLLHIRDEEAWFRY